MVLNEKQRVAKRKLIEENRERRRRETVPVNQKDSSENEQESEAAPQLPLIELALSEEDSDLINCIVSAFERSVEQPSHPTTSVSTKY